MNKTRRVVFDWMPYRRLILSEPLLYVERSTYEPWESVFDKTNIATYNIGAGFPSHRFESLPIWK